MNLNLQKLDYLVSRSKNAKIFYYVTYYMLCQEKNKKVNAVTLLAKPSAAQLKKIIPKKHQRFVILCSKIQNNHS